MPAEPPIDTPKHLFEAYERLAAGATLPILLAADAMILVGGQRGEREVPASDFFVSYRKTALALDELILHVRFPLARGRELRFRKVGTRRAQAISKVVMALAWED